jgi:hypothetical protein
MDENLRRKDITQEEVQNIWQTRRGRMKNHRQRFEMLWRAGLGRYLETILSPNSDNYKKLYNQLYEQYDTSLYSREGLRFTDMKYPLLPAIIMRALASEIPNKPKVNFIAVGSNDPSKAKGFRALFNQVLYEMDANQEDFETHLDKRVFGSAASLVITETWEQEFSEPTFNNKTGKYEYEKETKKISKCGYRRIDLRHLLLDEHCTKSSLEDCKYAQIDEYYSRQEFIQKFSKYGKGKVEEIAMREVTKEEQDVYSNIYDTQDAQFIRVTHCFDEVYDRYHILAFDELLNDKDNPIPRKAGKRGKKIPIALAIQYKIPGAPYGFGDSHITTTFNKIKNLVRIMILEITQKMSKPLMAVDPLSSFDEQEFEWGQDFIRVSPKELQQITISPNLQYLYDLDELTNNDIITSTGININDTSSADAGETARKTVIRRESQNALIEMTMNYMSDSYYKRLYTLLSEDIRLHYISRLESGEKIKVRTDNVELNRANGGFDEVKVKGARYFDLEIPDVDLDIELDLELGNMASSRELDKALAKEGTEALSPFVQFFDGKGIAQWLQETFDMPDEVLGQDASSLKGKDSQQIAQENIAPQFLPEQQQLEMQNQQSNQQPIPNEAPAQSDQGLPAMPPV